MTATSAGKTAVIRPVMVGKAVVAGSSYASAALLKLLKVRPYQREVRQIEMMLGAVTKQVEIFQVQVSSTSGDLCLDTEVTKVDKNQLLSLENPRYEQCLAKYAHLKGIEMEDKDSKDIMPVHLILGASDYAKIKTETAARVGALGEPIGEDQARLDHNVSWEGSGFNSNVLHTDLTRRLWQLMQVRCTGPGCYVHWWPSWSLSRVQRAVDTGCRRMVWAGASMERQPSFPTQQRSRKSSTVGEPCEKVMQPRDNWALWSSHPGSDRGWNSKKSLRTCDRESGVLHPTQASSAWISRNH